jgi:hypothetical protein
MPGATAFSRRTSPAFAVGGLGYEPESGVRSDYGVTFTPYGGWACYHCGERFTHWLDAERHFGKTPKELPACIGAAFELAAAYREWWKTQGMPRLPERLTLALLRVDRLRWRRERRQAG